MGKNSLHFFGTSQWMIDTANSRISEPDQNMIEKQMELNFEFFKKNFNP